MGAIHHEIELFHAYLPSGYARYGNMASAVLCVVAETFDNIGLPVQAGGFIIAALLYTETLGVVMLASSKDRLRFERTIALPQHECMSNTRNVSTASSLR